MFLRIGTVLGIALVFATVARPGDILEVFGHRWSVPLAADWKIDQEEGAPVLRLLTPRPMTAPRRPYQFALAQTPSFQRVTVEAEVRRRQGSLIIVYAYRDPAHFNYAHLSIDAAAMAPHHNGIFHVYGGERVRISSVRGKPSLATTDWHKVKLEFDGPNGRASVLVDGESNPSLEGVDLSLTEGRVGIGSFFETADFRNVRITGEPAEVRISAR
ncbi:MAG: hypothetical protein ACK5AZ_13990 [Bryobacteraceae bacterium]